MHIVLISCIFVGYFVSKFRICKLEANMHEVRMFMCESSVRSEF